MHIRWTLILPLAMVLSTTPALAGRDLHVAQSPRASDANDGSADRPWKTISHAAKMIQPGDTAWVHEGVYRETVVVDKSGEGPDKMLSFRAAPGEIVTIKGSEVVTGWTRSPQEPERPIWEADWPFPHVFPGIIGADDTPLIPLNVPAATEELKPPKAYCQYFLGFGRGRAAMFPGSFFYDEARRKVLVWLKGDENPNDHQMEGAVRACWLSCGDYILVEGLRFRYAPLVVPIGGVAFVMCGPGGGGAPADGCVVRGCEVSLAAFEGMVVRGGKRVSTVVEDCWVHHNGNGCGSFEGQGDPDTDSWMIVRRCRLTDNNVFNWNPSWHAGGKHFGNRILFDQCEFARQYNSPGLWFDCHNRDCVVNRCYSHDHGQFGLYYEIGETGAFLNNVVEGGPHCAAIGLNGSSRTLIAHNLVVGSERGILVGWGGNIEGPISRVTCYNRAFNNVLLGHGSPLLTVPADDAATRDNVCDGNLLWQVKAAVDPGQARLFEEQVRGEAYDLTTWRQRRGLDLASRIENPGLDLWNARMGTYRAIPALRNGRPLTEADLRQAFDLRPMPEITAETVSSSIREHRPASEAFLRKVVELLRVPQDAAAPVGPVPPVAATPVRAVAVENPSFETPGLSPGALGEGAPGWQVTPSAPGLVRTWHAASTGLWNWYMPEGTNVLVTRPPADGDLRVSQTLREGVRPDTRYELSVWTGMAVNQAKLPWPRATLALWAGDRRLGLVELPEPKIHPHYGVWIQNRLVCETGTDVPAGQPLRIEIAVAGARTAEACFDSVALCRLAVGELPSEPAGAR